MPAQSHPLSAYLQARRIGQTVFAREAKVPNTRISEILRWRNPSPVVAKKIEEATRAASKRGARGGVVTAQSLLYFWPSPPKSNGGSANGHRVHAPPPHAVPAGGSCCCHRHFGELVALLATGRIEVPK
jgi:hypothetical protein